MAATTLLSAVGYIGLGIMGRAMAGHLLRAGYPLTVYNRTRAKADPLIAAGAKLADSPKAVAETSEIIFTNVTDSPDLESVILGSGKRDAVTDGVRPGSVVIDNSTVAPASARKIADALAKKNVPFLDAPVTGGEKGAIEATLAIMVGGDEQAF
jgi:3-hydroxyisobutyrate dehydrogenase-like beta-hydroxyacid dehydrogenase